jgi:hypothetical protein
MLLVKYVVTVALRPQSDQLYLIKGKMFTLKYILHKCESLSREGFE